MNGTQSPEAQKPPPTSAAGTNGHTSNSSSLAAKKRKKEGLKPIITMEGPQGPGAFARTAVALSIPHDACAENAVSLSGTRNLRVHPSQRPWSRAVTESAWNAVSTPTTQSLQRSAFSCAAQVKHGMRQSMGGPRLLGTWFGEAWHRRNANMRLGRHRRAHLCQGPMASSQWMKCHSRRTSKGRPKNCIPMSRYYITLQKAAGSEAGRNECGHLLTYWLLPATDGWAFMSLGPRVFRPLIG
ncbi:hypothetical protein ACJZ2D_008744 [Fusarium nematophilum]